MLLWTGERVERFGILTCWLETVTAVAEGEMCERREVVRVVFKSAVQHFELDDNGVRCGHQGDAGTFRFTSGVYRR